jgi:catalase
MRKNDLAGFALDTMERVAGCLPGYRRAHSRGLALLGNFRASPKACELSSACHFQGGEIPCLVRVSNSEGRPFAPDRVAPGQGRVMGFAIRFSLPEGKFATWAGINVPAFPARTPEEFIALTAAQKRGRNGKPNRARLVWHLIRHLHILAAVKRIQALPLCESLALENYYGIHTYFLVDAAGRRRPFRYQWLAAQKAGVGDDAPPLGQDLYLMDEIRRRLARGPLAWDLVAQIPAAGDDLLNASRAWPDDREKILLGHLTLDRVHGNQAETELVVFDPTGVVPGLETSDDPILKFRPMAYALSYARREKENRTAPAPADMGQ